MAKRIVDLTQGGKCDRCDTERCCVVCGPAVVYSGNDLFYSQSGDHDHLVMYHGSLGREAHGVLMCATHNDLDRTEFEAIRR